MPATSLGLDERCNVLCAAPVRDYTKFTLHAKWKILRGNRWRQRSWRSGSDGAASPATHAAPQARHRHMQFLVDQTPYDSAVPSRSDVPTGDRTRGICTRNVDDAALHLLRWYISILTGCRCEPHPACCLLFYSTH